VFCPVSPRFAPYEHKSQHDVLNAYFLRADVPVVAGEFRFRVRPYLLREALETTELTTKPKLDAFNKVYVTLYRDRLKFQTSNGVSFTEYLVPLFEPSPSIPADRAQDLAPSFVFNHALLLRLVQRLPEDTPGRPNLEFLYVADQKSLHFQTLENPDDLAPVVQKDFHLTCEARSEFGGSYRSPLTINPTFLGKINPVVLRKAVRYVALFAPKYETRPTLNLIELRDGVLVGGTQMQMGRFESAALKGVNLKIKVEQVATVEKMLARMNADDTSVCETEQYTLLTDGVLVFGFERESLSFPDVTDMYTRGGTSDNHVLAPRAALLNSLTAVDKSSDLLVELTLTGEGSSIPLHLLTHESAGKECRDFVRVNRYENSGQTSAFKEWRFSVHIKVLLDLVKHFESTNVHFEVFNDKALYVYDEEAENGIEGCVAQSLLCFLTQAQTNTMRERQAQAAAAVRRLHS
jgi:hypothetical protein